MTTTPIQKLLAGLVIGLTTLTGNAFAANKNPTVCVFDFLGQKGPVFGIARELKLLSELDGKQFNIEAYTNEKVANEDFVTGKCDGLVATGLRTRAFNSFAGSIEAIGGVPNYDIMRSTLNTLQDKKYAPLLENDKFAIAGIIPVGQLYFYVNDKSINSLGKAAGKRIASFDYDKAQSILIARAGATPVSSDVTRFMTQFNNGSVDVVVAPALAFKRLELYRGIGDKGAVIDLPLGILTYQIVLRKPVFDAKTISRLRALTSTKVELALGAANDAEHDIPNNLWLKLGDAERIEYYQAMRDARISMRDSGIYDKNMMTLLRVKRCEARPTEAECGLKQE